MSESNRVGISYIKETVYGETPVDAVWQASRFTAEQYTATPNTTTSSEIRNDRMTSDMPKVGLSVSGGQDIELSMGTYDDFIEAAMASNWQADTPAVGQKTIDIGAVDHSFSIEKAFNDINKYISFSGMRVDTMSFEFSYGAIATGSFGLAGNGAVAGDTSAVGAGSITAATTTPVLNASTDIGSITIDGAPTGICINSISFELSNGLREITCVGRDAPTDQRKGTSSVTGSLEMYLNANSFALYGKALLNEEIALQYTVGGYTFIFPRVKLSGEAPQAGGLDQDVMFSAEFTALIDDVTGTSFRIISTV